jgi:hypothetical protein
MCTVVDPLDSEGPVSPSRPPGTHNHGSTCCDIICPPPSPSRPPPPSSLPHTQPDPRPIAEKRAAEAAALTREQQAALAAADAGLEWVEVKDLVWVDR